MKADLVCTLNRRIIVASLVMVLFFAFIAVPAIVAETPGAYVDITVDEAYKMVKKARGNLVILDVRNESEYILGHLYDAVLVPVYELEDRISELQGHINDPIIVYCKAGSRSQIASQILVDHGFAKVYNMLGGIMAWIEAGYPIYTTYHHVTVDVVGKHVSTNIEPLLLYQTGYTSCGCQLCTQNQTCPNGNASLNIMVDTLEQNENRTVTLITYEVNSTIHQVTIKQTLIWTYNQTNGKTNRTAKFTLTEIATENNLMIFYGLNYMAYHEEYNLTIQTNLIPLDPETYRISVTIADYKPSWKSKITSLEFIEFNTSVNYHKNILF